MNLLNKYADIRTRELVLYGTEEDIKNFLKEYSHLLNIRCAITDHINEVKVQAYREWGIETVMLESVELDTVLIVLCSKERFVFLQKRLEHTGNKEYENYIGSELIESLVYGKKLILCMGTHLLEQVVLLLNNCNAIRELYSIVYYKEDEVMQPYMNRMQEFRHIGKCCDVYVSSSCEKERYYLKTLKKKDLSSDCITIRVADYGFAGYFPQLDKNRDNMSDYLLRERERLDMSYETLTFSKTDRELEKCCKENIPIEEIIDTVTDVNYFAENMVLNYFAEEVGRFKFLEVNDDIKLGEFIEQHKEQCLCRNLNEWNEPVISYIAERLADMLNLPGLDMDREARNKLIEENSGSEFPIYPSVQKALGLEDTLAGKYYKVVTYYSVKYMNVHQYMDYIATYLYKAMDIMQFTGMDQTLEEK